MSMSGTIKVCRAQLRQRLVCICRNYDNDNGCTAETDGATVLVRLRQSRFAIHGRQRPACICRNYGNDNGCNVGTDGATVFLRLRQGRFARRMYDKDRPVYVITKTKTIAEV